MVEIKDTEKYCEYCGEKHKGYGYCDKHYQKYKKYLCPLYKINSDKCQTCSKSKEEQLRCIATIE